MFNKLKTTTLAAVMAAATLLGAESAWALDGPTSSNTGIFGYSSLVGPDGNFQFDCINVTYRPNDRASVFLNRNDGNGPYFAGGGLFTDPNTILYLAPWNTTQLEQCGYENVTNLQQNGADGTLLTDDYIGATWSAFDPALGQNVDCRAEIVGRVNTVVNLGCTVTAPTNTAPTANAGPDQTVASATAPVTLNGSGSSDLDAGQNLTYAWTAPAGITLSDATAENPTFTATTRAEGDADVTLTFSLTVTDNLGLSSTADTVTVTVVAGVSVELSGGPDQIINTDPFNVTATFSGAVREFDDLAADVIIANGSLTAISGGPSVYTLTIQPTGNGDVEITVPAGAARLDRNDIEIRNAASNTLVIGNQIVEITQEAIAGFMLGRANNLASNQPGLTRFLMGDGCGAFSANATDGSGAISGCVSNGNTWAEITGSWSGGDSYVLGSFGTHGFVNPNLLIGGMLQFDRAEDSANNASGTGYMIGPYFVAQVPDQPLFFEGRLLYGQTDNDISPLGTYTDSFETERWLAQLRATGEYQYQNTTLMPLLDFTYTDDTQQAYTDNLNNAIPGQTVSLMQLTAGMDFSTPIPVSTGALNLTGGLSGIYSSSDGAAAAPEFENWRGRTHLGLDYDMGNGATFNATTFYDGLGTDYEAYGASIGFDLRF